MFLSFREHLLKTGIEHVGLSFVSDVGKIKLTKARVENICLILTSDLNRLHDSTMSSHASSL